MDPASIHYLHVQITRFSRDDNPGWVACEFFDAESRLHTFEEKAPVVSLEYLDEASEYPRPGMIACTVLTRWQESNGRDLVRINTDIPWDIESAEGLSEFVVLSAQLGADGPDVTGFVETAKRVLTANAAVLYGIFGIIGTSGYFPPRAFLNEFLMRGCDPCDQDQRMGRWKPFALSPEEYHDVFSWWLASHAGTVEDGLGVEHWDDWVQKILDRY